ncbi:hypothetical protein WJX72_009495 [[Myrmecia] bisecta]|uniref:adenylate kinase n=1 Tax=[Myrmecia] bisecta TaxID=41462 RepID=A0AAW1R9H8_9CHLO
MRSAAKKLLEAGTPARWLVREAAPKLEPALLRQARQPAAHSRQPAIIFLGPPGVGKGTYSSRVASSLSVPHISAGDLVRMEINQKSEYGMRVAQIVNAGNLLPDSLILELLQNRLAEGAARGEQGVLLDGFPRTRAQAEALTHFTDVQLAVNLSLQDKVLVSKCLGRRICRKCGKNFNVADILLPATAENPEIVLPPLLPPQQCEQYMETRTDDNIDTINRRLQVYHQEAAPVEQFFRDRGVLLDFEITGGIPETLPRLIEALRPHGHLLEDDHSQTGRQGTCSL